MSLNIQPKESAPMIPVFKTTNNSDSRTRAIAAYNNVAAPSDLPVQNATNIAPEEMGAIRAATSSIDSEQKHPSEETASVQADQPVRDAIKEESKVAPKDPLSTQYAILARKEKALRASMQKLQAERDAFKAEQSKLSESKDSEIKSQYISKDKLLQDTFGTLSELGISYDQLTNLALNQPSSEELAFKRFQNEQKSEMQKLREEQENIKKMHAETQQQQYEQALGHIKHEVSRLVATDDNFETIRTTGSIGDVVDLIERKFKADGILLSVEEAAEAVENHLIDEYLKIANIKKIQSRLKPVSAPVASQATKLQEPMKSQPQMKTLTNAVSSARPLSARERAILAFKGENK
jgi:hypothetical protein